jgi:hypothetical protein
MRTLWSIVVRVAIGLQSGAAPTLLVQGVDPGWLPMPRLTVHAIRVPSCPSKSALAERAVNSITDESGYARFDVPADANYLLIVDKRPGLVEIRKCIHVFNRSVALPTAYVQLQMNDTTETFSVK